MNKVYIDLLKGYFYISGSVCRYKYKKPIMVMLSEISDTLPEIFEKENAEYNPHDLDLIYIIKDDTDYKILLERFQNDKSLEIIQIKKDLFMLKHKITNIRIDVFICKQEHFYFYYLFTLLGKKINIILRKKAMKYNLLLNQYGLFNRENNNLYSYKIKYNKNKSIFYNIGLIIKKIYFFEKIKSV